MLHSTGKQYPVYNDSEGVKLHQQKTVAEEEKEEGKKKSTVSDVFNKM